MSASRRSAGRPRADRLAFAAALVLAFAAPGVAARDGGAPPPAPVGEVGAATLAEHLRAPRRESELLAALLDLGPRAIPAELDALRDEAVRDADVEVALTPSARAAVVGALVRLGRTTVLPYLRQRIEQKPTAADRAAVVEVLAELGRDLDLLLAACALAPEESGLEPRLARALDLALARLFEREPALLDEACEQLASAEPHCAAAIARAVVGSRSPAAFDLLARPLGVEPALDLTLLPHLARAPGRRSSPREAAALEVVRGHLASDQPMLARCAVVAAGELEDTLAVPALVGLLAGEDRALSAAAHRSLVRITGLALPDQAARWEAWLAAEQAWHLARGEDVLDALRSQQSARIAPVLQELVAHCLHRGVYAAEIAATLEHDDPLVRRLACKLLGELDGEAGVRALEAHADDPDAAVAATAGAALEKVARRRAARPDALLAAPKPGAAGAARAAPKHRSAIATSKRKVVVAAPKPGDRP